MAEADDLREELGGGDTVEDEVNDTIGVTPASEALTRVSLEVTTTVVLLGVTPADEVLTRVSLEVTATVVLLVVTVGVAV